MLPVPWQRASGEQRAVHRGVSGWGHTDCGRGVRNCVRATASCVCARACVCICPVPAHRTRGVAGGAAAAPKHACAVCQCPEQPTARVLTRATARKHSTPCAVRLQGTRAKRACTRSRSKPGQRSLRCTHLLLPASPEHTHTQTYTYTNRHACAHTAPPRLTGPANTAPPRSLPHRQHGRPYHEAIGTPGFFPVCEITFNVTDGKQHYHVPLLLSPFSYSTYRGS